MATGIGNARKEPALKAARPGSLKVTITPSVTSCAMPRPATMRMRVATIGWSSRTATRKPLSSPQPRPTPSAASTTTGSGWPAMIIVAATAPAMAMTAPTERSTPLVAITIVMPIARMATGAPRLSTSMRLPNSRPSCRRMLKKPSKAIQLKKRISARQVSFGAARFRPVMRSPLR